MKKMLKWFAIVLGAIFGLLLIALAAIYIISDIRINKSYEAVAIEEITIPTDADSIARGRHLVDISCVDCHGEDLGGAPLIEDKMMANLYAANLTTGEGGVAENYSDGGLVRAIRQGIGSDNKSLWFMPAQEFNHWSDQDVASIVAYIRGLDQVDNQQPKNSGGPLGRLLFLAGTIPLLPAEIIDHAVERPVAPPEGITAEYGAYLGRGCTGCHGADLAGGPIPGAPPGSPAAENLTPAGDLVGWSEEQFLATIRTGTTPNGRQLDPEWMPWPTFSRMTDDELKAIWLYLQSVPPVEAGA